MLQRSTTSWTAEEFTPTFSTSPTPKYFDAQRLGPQLSLLEVRKGVQNESKYTPVVRTPSSRDHQMPNCRQWVFATIIHHICKTSPLTSDQAHSSSTIKPLSSCSTLVEISDSPADNSLHFCASILQWIHTSHHVDSLSIDSDAATLWKPSKVMNNHCTYCGEHLSHKLELSFPAHGVGANNSCLDASHYEYRPREIWSAT